MVHRPRAHFGEALASPQSSNHRGRIYRTYDGGGEAATPGFDFKGLPTSTEVKLLLDPTAKNDWTVIANQSTIAAMGGDTGAAGKEGAGAPGEGASPTEEAAVLLGVLTGEELATESGETRMGLPGGMAPEGTKVSASWLIAALITREALFELALGVAGFAGRALWKVNLEKVAKRLDEFAEKLRSAHSSVGGEVPGESGVPSSAGTDAPTSSVAPEGAVPEGAVPGADGAFAVTPDGVVLPKDAKHQIPGSYVEKPHQPGSYGEIVDGKFKERLRIDPPTPPGQKGPNASHYPIDGKGKHYSPKPGDRDPGFR